MMLTKQIFPTTNDKIYETIANIQS